MSQFQILPTAIPTVKKQCFGFDTFLFHSTYPHFLKMVILGFAICLFSIHSKINGVVFPPLAIYMYEIDYTNSPYQTINSTTILFLDKFD